MGVELGLQFSASIRLLSTAEGGRRGAIAQGYIPNFSFDHGASQCGARMQIHGHTAVAPGEVSEAALSPLNDDFFAEVRPGDEIDFYEGPRKVGTATIRGVLHR